MVRMDLQVNSDLKPFSSDSNDRQESQKSKMDPAKTAAKAGVKRLKEIVLILLATEHTPTLDAPLITPTGCLLK